MKKRTIIIITVSVVILILIISIPTALLLNKQYCHLNLKEDLTFNHPLILQLNNNEFILPNKNGIDLEKGETIRLVCGEKNQFNITEDRELHATCVSNQIFTTNIIKLGEIKFKDLNCKSIPAPTAKRMQQVAEKSRTEIEIGFQTNAGFVLLYTTCFNDIKKDSLYSKFTLSTAISNQQTSRSTTFLTGDFYNDVVTDVNSLYAYTKEINTFATIIGMTNAQKYFDKSKFYSRGHLTANADFNYDSQKSATFYFMNVAPQWYNFNSGNWNKLEQDVRNYAGKQIKDLIIYTGIHGQAKLLDDNNILKDLYLYTKGVQTYFTVPDIYWKLVYNPFYHTATVFVGHNNIYDSKINRYCTDICDKISWLTWDAKNVTAGLSYCCDYYEFKNVVEILPDLLIFGYLV